MKVRTIRTGNEYMDLHETGEITRPKIGMTIPSGKWRIIGAVEYNNFGYIIKRYTLDDVINNPNEIPWRYKNGKQKTHLIDFDYGTNRIWGSPDHEVF